MTQEECRSYLRNNNRPLKYVPLSDEEKEYIAEHSADTYPSKIARYIGCPLGTVYGHIVRHKLPRCGVPGKKWNSKKAEVFLDMYNRGVNFTTIMKIYGIKDAKNVKHKASYLSKLHGIDLTRRRKMISRPYVVRALRESNGDRSKAALALGVCRRTIATRIKEYNITIDKRHDYISIY